MSGETDRILLGQAPGNTGSDDCHCCEGLEALTPSRLHNRSGLDAVSYRAGTHAQFKSTMLARLSSADFPALAGLKTRDDEDFTIALIDAWATVCDVLSFYQERIANEAWLPTATERLSIIEMTRLIGYRPRPGVAAEGHVALFLEEAAGAEAPPVPALRIQPGLRLQNVPGPDEKAQTFETVDEIQARVAWNRLKPRKAAMVYPLKSATNTWFKGTDTRLSPGDVLIFVHPDRFSDATAGWNFHRVVSVEPDADGDRTYVEWDEALSSTFETAGDAPRVYALRQNASLFGHNAPHPMVLPQETRGRYGFDAASTNDWNFSLTNGIVDLDAVYKGIATDSWISVVSGGTQRLFRVESVREAARTGYAASGRITRLDVDSDSNGDFDGNNYRPATAYFQSEELVPAETPLTEGVWGDEIHLDGQVEGMEPPRPVLVRGKRARLRVLESGIALEADNGLVHTPAVGDDLVLLARSPHASPGQWHWELRTADGFEGEAVASDTAFAPQPPDKNDEAASELAIVTEIDTHTDGRSVLTLKEPLAHVYDRFSTEIFGNVAPISHGESVSELLGGGKPRASFQRFDLKQSPLTHVRSAGASGGAASTLEIRVNNLRWKEAPAFYGRSSDERIYITELSHDGTTTVMFGDGKTGARPPAGRDNITARYRKGIGRAGNVPPGTITTLLDRPLGLSEAVNATAMRDGADPETRDEARSAAPARVMTLGRVVSLRDFEDFARSYAGISKARADFTWDGSTHRVLLTVAGDQGAELEPGSLALQDLISDLKAAGDPHTPFAVASYRPAWFSVGFQLTVHPDHDKDIVCDGVETAIRSAFGFEARAFAQPVMLSEVIHVVHSVDGVIAVTVDPFEPVSSEGNGATRLSAEGALLSNGALLGAELLMVDRGPFARLEVKS